MQLWLNRSSQWTNLYLGLSAKKQQIMVGASILVVLFRACSIYTPLLGESPSEVLNARGFIFPQVFTISCIGIVAFLLCHQLAKLMVPSGLIDKDPSRLSDVDISTALDRFLTAHFGELAPKGDVIRTLRDMERAVWPNAAPQVHDANAARALVNRLVGLNQDQRLSIREYIVSLYNGRTRGLAKAVLFLGYASILAASVNVIDAGLWMLLSALGLAA